MFAAEGEQALRGKNAAKLHSSAFIRIEVSGLLTST